MAEENDFVVYSELAEGFLTTASPSTWLSDPAGAIAFAAETDARKAAGRRRDMIAKAGKLITAQDGRLEFKHLPEGPAPGEWVIEVTRAGFDRFYYLVRGTKVVTLSPAIQEARGYKTQQAAEQVAAKISSGGALTTKVRQVTGVVLNFPVAPQVPAIE